MREAFDPPHALGLQFGYKRLIVDRDRRLVFA